MRQQADLIVTTPGDVSHLGTCADSYPKVKSLLLRFLEQLEVSSDRTLQ